MDKGEQEFEWEKEFEEKFKLGSVSTPDYWRIIVGQEPYKQYIGHIPLESPKPSSYQGLGVAFLVNKWIKIQDSLEMIFQLLCCHPYSGQSCSYAKPLKILAYLREKNIPSEQFADYLYRRHKVMLINIVDIKGNKLQQRQYLKNLLSQGKNHRVLFVGKKAEAYYSNSLFNNCIKGCILHPSGANLNFNRLSYYNSWYRFSPLQKCNRNFQLQDFKVF